jgi:hypothetical protein
MTGKLLSVVCAAIAAGVLGFSQAHAATFVYNVIAPTPPIFGTGTLSGTITTDVNTGVLSQSDIVSWDIVQSANTVQFGSTLDPANSMVSLTGTALTATATGLFFNFGATDNSLLEFFTPPGTGNNLQFCDATTPCTNQNGAQSFSDIVYVFVAPGLGSTSGSSPQGLATTEIAAAAAPAATPLPAALPLFATGLGGLGLLGWRRKRKGF